MEIKIHLTLITRRRHSSAYFKLVLSLQTGLY